MSELTTRKMAVLSSGPQTINEEARTVDAVMTTEAPAKVVDWERWEIVDEILILDGASYEKQLPLLNSHDRSGVEQVLGSVRNIRRDGDALVGTVHFSSVPEADSAMTKVREGHLTDFSIGYTVQESIWVPEGERYAIGGRTFDGPVKLSTKFEIKELSICPIGADKLAKARAAAANLQPKEEPVMEPKDEGRSPVATPNPVDEAAVRASAAEAERNRAKELMAMGRKFDVLDLAEKAVADGTSVADFSGVVLGYISSKKSGETPEFKAEIVAEATDKFRAAAIDAVLLRAGIAKPAASNDLACLTMRELARECLIRSGQRSPMNVLELVGRALTTSDLPYILAAAANKALFEGYERAEETWSQWCGVGSAPDFKTLSIVRASEMSDLDEIPESQEYKYGTADDAREQVALATYGKLFAISRQAIINDDLSALSDIPAAHGEAAARKVGDVAYAVLTANANMADGVALFAAGHGNLAGSAGAVSVSTLAAAIAAMKKQKDILGKRRLNIKPQFFVAPVDLEGTCEQLFMSNLEGTQAKPGQVNPYSGNYFARVYDSRLSDASTTAWYLAGPKGKTVTVFFLNGQQAPYLETKEGWSVDGVEYKVRIDAAAKAVDYRALYKNAGA